ncbi:MAG: histone-lysine N-methyltransferase [Deltaproteobacteria bacterium]|nr:MAG: histone-lysine N-methyltransferase [Deltaproteobacteria bacterium]
MDHNLINVAAPELYRSIYPYKNIGRMAFDDRFVLPRLPKELFITDTTFRDGQQARPPYTVKQIGEIYDLLHQMGGHSGLIRQSEFFLYSDKDKRAVELCQSKGYRFPEVTAWIRAHAEDLKLVQSMGIKETGMLTSVSDYHIYMKLGKDRKTAMQDYLKVVEQALDHGILPRCHFEDITRADIYGFCIPFAQQLMELSHQSGIPVKIRLCDTMGFGVPYPGAALPRSVGKIVRAFTDEASVPSEWLEWHGHNDFHKALINTTTAWIYGCSGANGTLLGFGERTGNAPIEALVVEYISLTGDDDAAITHTISEIGSYFSRELGYNIPHNYPFVGRDFNTTSAGIHVDGLIKNEEIYNIFDTKHILNRPVPITITDKSGKAGVAYWINTALELDENRKVDKRHPAVSKIAKRIQESYTKGRTTRFSYDEMHAIVARFMPELFSSSFDQLKDLAQSISSKIIGKLAEHPDITSLEREKAATCMAAFLEDYPFIQYLYLIDTKGFPITWQVSHPEDKALYTTKLGPDHNFSDREWFMGPMKSGRVCVTDFYHSYLSGKLCLTVSTPVCDAEDEIQAILGADIRFEELVKIQESIKNDEKEQELD